MQKAAVTKVQLLCGSLEIDKIKTMLKEIIKFKEIVLYNNGVLTQFSTDLIILPSMKVERFIIYHILINLTHSTINLK